MLLHINKVGINAADMTTNEGIDATTNVGPNVTTNVALGPYGPNGRNGPNGPRARSAHNYECGQMFSNVPCFGSPEGPGQSYNPLEN